LLKKEREFMYLTALLLVNVRCVTHLYVQKFIERRAAVLTNPGSL
jgi:hypothetical protein